MNYAKAQALAERLISKNGRQVAFQKLKASGADPAKPWKGAGAPTVEKSTTVKAAFLAVAGMRDLGLTFVDKDLLKRCEEVALLSGKVALEDYHTILDGAKLWKINWLQALKPGDTVVMYAVGVSQ